MDRNVLCNQLSMDREVGFQKQWLQPGNEASTSRFLAREVEGSAATR
jgi:hypothetical protein